MSGSVWTRCPSSARGSCDICSLSLLCCKWRHSFSTWLASPTWRTPHQLPTQSLYWSQRSVFERFKPCPRPDLMASRCSGFWAVRHNDYDDDLTYTCLISSLSVAMGQYDNVILRLLTIT